MSAVKSNALSLHLMQELIAAFREAGDDNSVRAVILGGNGPAFSAGHDLREMLCRDINSYRQIFDVCTELMTTIQATMVGM